MMMPGRKYNAGSEYRYGFNGKEKDSEIKVKGNSYDFGTRIHDPRLGRWLSSDIITKPFISPYNYSSNDPLNYLDPNGEDNIHFYYVITRTYVDGKLINAKPIKFSVIERNNEPNIFVHHKVELRFDGVGSAEKATVSKQIDTRFYPDVPGESSGLTTSYGFLKIKDNDRKTLIKFIDEYSLSRQDADVNYTEIDPAGSSGSKRLKNAQWWGGVFAEKKFQEKKEKEETVQRDLVINGVLLFGGEILLAGRAVEGAMVLERGAFEKLVEHGFREGRNADIGLLYTETAATRTLNLINSNQSKLKEGYNYLLTKINGLQKSITVKMEKGVVQSMNMLPGLSKRMYDTKNAANIINLGSTIWLW